MNWICKLFGHKINDIELFILKLRRNEDEEDIKELHSRLNLLECKRCHERLFGEMK